MQVLHKFTKIINLQTVIVTGLSLLATYFCIQINFIVDLPTGLIGIAIVFPIVFSINAAYRRREEALNYFAAIKADAFSIYYVHRDSPPAPSTQHQQRAERLIIQLLETFNHFFTEQNDRSEHLKQIYRLFSQISRSIEQLRKAGVHPNEISRTHQFLRHLILDFERMRNILVYRTPISLRTYSQVFLNAFPIFFAPYFAYLSSQFNFNSGFFFAALYSLVLVSLDNIQENLENPYDQIGSDDLNLNIAQNFRQFLKEDIGD